MTKHTHAAGGDPFCDGCLILALMRIRRRLEALKRSLPRMDGPGDVDEALRGILSEIPQYDASHREEPGSLEGAPNVHV